MEKKIFRNVGANIILQVVLTVSGLIIPRYILAFYGSEMNGLVSSISQFITYAALIEMGIGDATIIALYKPIAENNIKELGSILTTSKKLYSKSGYIYIAIILILAMVYPLLLIQQFEYTFTFLLFLGIGSINAIDYFILGKYKVFLIADQKYYVLNVARIFATIVLTVGSILLLYNNASILLVKVFAVLTHLGEALFIYFYIKIKYSCLNYHSNCVSKIEQRWNALVCQICATIVYNTDLVILTLFLPGRSLSEISVYTVYSMVFSLLTNLSASLITGINASFGNLYAKGENNKLFRFFVLYELIYFIMIFTACSCFAVLIVPFVSCYTKGIQDADYIRYGVGLLFAANGLSAQVKDVSGMINMATGKLKAVRQYAVEEAAVNIIISLLLVRKFGIIGVLFGTLISHILMSAHTISYAAKQLVHNTRQLTLRRILRNLLVVIVMVLIELYFINISLQWSVWLLQTIVVVITNGFIIVGVNYLCEPAMVKDIVAILKRKINSILIK